MKKNFRNRLLAVTAAASMSFLLLSGFDSALTAEDVQENMRSAIASEGGMSADVQGTADVSIDISAGDETSSLPISGSMNYSVVMNVDPFFMAVCGSASGDASAIGMSGNLEMDMYLKGQDDGSGIMYVRMPMAGDTEWHAAEVPVETMSQMLQSVQSSLSGDVTAIGEQLGVDLSSMQEQMTADMTLAPEAVNVNGEDCYELSMAVDGDTLFNIVSMLASAVPETGIDSDTLSIFQMLFSGIRMDVISDCSVETFAPVYGSVDLSGSDLSLVGQMIGAMMLSGDDDQEMPQIGVTVNALNYTVNFNDVPDQLEIPAEALAAEVETTISLQDAAQAVEALE